MLKLVAMIIGTGATVALARAARRGPIRGRIRVARARTARVLPRIVREPLARALRDAQLDVSPEDAVLAATLGVVVTGLLGSAFSIGLVPVAVLGAAAAGPVTLALARGRGQRRFLAALPEFVDLIAARLRSGHTVPTALADAAHARDPIAADVRGVLRRVELGEPFSTALDWWATTRGLDAVRAVAGSLAVALDTGGAGADALEGLARSLRDQLGARAEAAALSAQARLSAMVVGLAPVVYVAFACAVDPASAATLVTTSIGRICLVSGLTLDALGALWMRRIVRSEP